MRSAIIAKKLGMTRIYNDAGEHVPVTVLQLDNCQVVAQRTKERDGYVALQLGAGRAKAKNTSRAMRGHFAKANVEPKRAVAECRVSDDGLIDVGAEITADHYVPGQFVDVTGTSIGKGFAGAIKRHNFGGLRASHGVSISHRSHGSTGQCQEPGKVFKGKKMAGHMGSVRVTTQNLTVAMVDPARGLVMVKGAVPGSANSWIIVRDAVKRALPDGAPTPGAFRMPEADEDGGAASLNAAEAQNQAAVAGDSDADASPGTDNDAAPGFEAPSADDVSGMKGATVSNQPGEMPETAGENAADGAPMTEGDETGADDNKGSA